MKNAYIFAVALESVYNEYITALERGADAFSLAGQRDNIINLAVAAGFYYTDEIERYLTAWNDHGLTRMLYAAQIDAHNEAVYYQAEYIENVLSWDAIAENTEYFENLGRKFNLLDEYRENAII